MNKVSDSVIKKFADFYSDKSNSYVVNMIIGAHPDEELSAAYLRNKVGKYRSILKGDTESYYLMTFDMGEEKPQTNWSVEEEYAEAKEGFIAATAQSILDNGYEYAKLAFEQAARSKPASELQPYLGGNPDNVLIIGDTQLPFEKKGYLEHCRAVQEKYNCGTVIHIGDLKDSHASSMHDSDPDGYSAGDELDVTVSKVAEWYRVFPKVKVCLGNHDLIILRKAFKAGLSKRWIKGLAEVLNTPDWEYDTEFVINGTMYTHTLGANVLKAALLRQVNLVVGHEHSQAKIEYAASMDYLIWAMKVGSGVDDRAYAFNYAKTLASKSIVSCAVVEGSIPHIIPMQL